MTDTQKNIEATDVYAFAPVVNTRGRARVGMRICGEVRNEQGDTGEVTHAVFMTRQQAQQLVEELTESIAVYDEQAAATPQTEKVTTDQLNPGDLVLHCDMRIRLGERSRRAGTNGRVVYYFPGTVENAAELREQPNHITRGLLDADGQWPVQGNDLATWFRVVEPAADTLTVTYRGAEITFTTAPSIAVDAQQLTTTYDADGRARGCMAFNVDGVSVFTEDYRLARMVARRMVKDYQLIGPVHAIPREL